VNWCESKPAITNAALPAVAGRDRVRYVIDYVPSVADMANNPSWVPSYYFGMPADRTVIIAIRGVNFGSRVQLDLEPVGAGTAQRFFFDAATMTSGTLDDDLVARSVHFDLRHAKGRELDEIDLRGMDVPPGEYIVTVTNLTDPNYPRFNDYDSVHLVVKCDAVEDFPYLAPTSPCNYRSHDLQVSGNGCTCRIGKTTKSRDSTDPINYDYYDCEDFSQCIACSRLGGHCVD
jgi:hypothetical protein